MPRCILGDSGLREDSILRGRIANMSGRDCILADRGPVSDSFRALAASSDTETGSGILPKDLIHPDMAPQRPDGPRNAA
jgi:hypothetical protein